MEPVELDKNGKRRDSRRLDTLEAKGLVSPANGSKSKKFHDNIPHLRDVGVVSTRSDLNGICPNLIIAAEKNGGVDFEETPAGIALALRCLNHNTSVTVKDIVVAGIVVPFFQSVVLDYNGSEGGPVFVSVTSSTANKFRMLCLVASVSLAERLFGIHRGSVAKQLLPRKGREQKEVNAGYCYRVNEGPNEGYLHFRRMKKSGSVAAAIGGQNEKDRQTSTMGRHALEALRSQSDAVPVAPEAAAVLEEWEEIEDEAVAVPVATALVEWEEIEDEAVVGEKRKRDEE